MKVSVLIPYFQGRRALLERTLWLLERQTYADYEVLILDDGSDEDIYQLRSKRIAYERLRPAGSPPRSSNTAYIHGYRKCQGDFIILTHPEYMAPTNAIARIVDVYDGSARLAAMSLALNPETTANLDGFPWRTDLDTLQDIPGFWGWTTPWGWQNSEARGWCHHFSFTGQTRDGWALTEFIPATEEPGMNDSWIVAVEVAMARPPMPAGFAVYHQHHRRPTEWPFVEQSVRIGRLME